ncbi:MAG: fumarylacetoacetase, partial [Tepidimonas sp.]
HDHLGVVIGDQVLDLGLLAGAGAFDGAADAEALKYLLHQPRWNMLASAPKFWPIVRGRVQALLNAETHAGQQVRRVRAKALRPLAETPLVMPVHVGDYTDFYASKHHATNVGAMFRPDNPLLPNYKHTPIGYHGRASSIGVGHAGAPMAVRRPRGQTRADDAAMPTFGPCRLLDYETEIGAVVGAGNALGEPIGTGRVAEHIFGVCL